MNKIICHCCRGTGEETIFSEKEWETYLEWKRANDKEFAEAEAIHGKGFVMLPYDEIAEKYDEWNK